MMLLTPFLILSGGAGVYETAAVEGKREEGGWGRDSGNPCTCQGQGQVVQIRLLTLHKVSTVYLLL
jgi:hypothetical protein